MLAVTFLGHQGWFISNGTNAIIVDPLLEPQFGRSATAAGQFPVFPPRAFALEAIPPITAVVITHEHEDHMHLPSLDRFARNSPVYLSARSSNAAHTVLGEMGFTVRPLALGAALRLGSLELHIVGDGIDLRKNKDEWDTTPFLVIDTLSGAAFFTNVDVSLSLPMLRRVRALATGYVLASSNGHLGELRVADGDGAAQAWIERVEGRRAAVRRTPATAEESASWLRAGAALQPLPGQTFTLAADALAEVEMAAPFLSVPARTEWPPEPPWFALAETDDYGPVCGRTDLADAELAELDAGLVRLAEGLYGGPLFQALYSLSAAALRGRPPKLLLVLLADAERSALIYEYDPRACAMRAIDAMVDGDPLQQYVGFIECWATDLLTLVRGEIEPRTLTQRRVRAHSRVVEPWFMASQLLWPAFHPLRHPDACLRRYRAIAAELVARAAGPEIRAAG